MDIENLNKTGLGFYTKTLWDKIKSRQGIGNYDGTPVGTVISYMGATPPEGYLACDGAIYNVALYPELVKHIRENFGSINFFGGDGVTTFAVPDLRAEFLRGTGTATRDTGSGADVGAHQDGTSIPGILSVNIGAIIQKNVSPRNTDINLVKENNWFSFRTDDGTYEGVESFTARPTNTSVLYCIKYQTTFQTPQRKYLINTDTLKLIADENRCYLYLDNYAIQENNKLIKIPSGYEPIFDSFYVVTNNDSGITAMTPSFLRIYKNGETTIQAFTDGAVIEDMKKGNCVHGSASWFYKEISG